MDNSAGGGNAPAVLSVAIDLVERGDWRAVLEPASPCDQVVGQRDAVRSVIALHLTARSMQLQAQGRLHDAWGPAW